jgi:hypothetical protein
MPIDRANTADGGIEVVGRLTGCVDPRILHVCRLGVVSELASTMGASIGVRAGLGWQSLAGLLFDQQQLILANHGTFAPTLFGC